MSRCLCPTCGLPALSPADDYACPCGQLWRDLAPFPRPHLVAAEWEMIDQYLLVRSGGFCEVRTPACLAGRRLLHELQRRSGSHLVSRHHRQARGMGGTTDPAIHSLANLLLICGHGTAGCHGWIEHHGGGPSAGLDAYRLGYLVPDGAPGHRTDATDPARVPLLTPSGRWVLLHPTVPEVTYLPAVARRA